MLKINRTKVWAVEIDDKPNGLATALQTMADYGADLECVIGRRVHEKPGKGVLFVTPLEGQDQVVHADQAGFHPTQTIGTLRVEGANHPGAGAEIARAIGDAGVNMHGLSAAVIGRRFVAYIGFDSTMDLEKAKTALEALNKHQHRWLDFQRTFGRKHHEEVVTPV